MSVAKKVKAYLEANNLTQGDVAQRINMHISTFNAMMNDRRMMYPEDMRAICLALKVKPEVFMGMEIV